MQPREPARFADPDALLRELFAHLAVPEKVDVAEAARRYRVLDNPGGGYSGPWQHERAPYLVRPMQCLTPDSGFSTVVVMGPSQCGKSDVGNNLIVYSVVIDPADMIFLAPDKQIMQSYMTSQVSKMIRKSPEVHRRQLTDRSADNVFSKQFVGCSLYAVWPVASQLRARPVPRARIDDYDAIPENIDGEGDALYLISGRQTAFEGFDVTYVNSSPARGSKRGIETLVTSGTDESWHVDCLQCRTPFVLDFDLVFDFDRKGSPDDARETARVVCPHCGGIHEQKDKPALMATGRWLAEGQTIVDGEIVGEIQRTSVASFRIDGLMGFATWGRLAELYRRAEIAWEQAQDEEPLRSFYNTRVGKNYTSKLAGAEPVEVSDLQLRAAEADYARATVPDGVVCLTAAVDIQGNRFEVEVVGWGEGRESWRIDRFPILALDDGTTQLQPNRRPEHWEVLLRSVIWRRYPLASDPEWSLPILNTAIDTGGIEGVTDNAFAFWHTAVDKGVPVTSITLIKGGNNPRAKLLPPPTVDVKRKRKGAPDAELFIPNVNRLKDMVDARMRREEPGPGYFHFFRDMDEAHLQELVAEDKVDGVWTRPHGVANETFDLEVYNLVALMRHSGANAHLSWVPDWARPQRRPATAAPSETGAAAAGPTQGAMPKRRRGVRIRTRGR